MTALGAAAAVFFGAALHSTTGFGFALLAAPLLAVLYGPQEAVSLVLVLALELNGLVLLTARGRPHAERRQTAALVACALPGLALGVIALTSLPERVLSALICLAVLAGVATRVLARRGARPRRPPRWALPAAGLSAGALTTSTGTNGPPLVLYLMHRRAGAAEMRDTLALLFLALALPGLALALAGGALELPQATLALLLAGLAGYEAGRRVFVRLEPHHHERLVLGVLVVTAILAGLVAVRS